jgi:hypothetical protein
MGLHGPMRQKLGSAARRFKSVQTRRKPAPSLVGCSASMQQGNEDRLRRKGSVLSSAAEAPVRLSRRATRTGKRRQP